MTRRTITLAAFHVSVLGWALLLFLGSIWTAGAVVELFLRRVG